MLVQQIEEDNGGVRRGSPRAIGEFVGAERRWRGRPGVEVLERDDLLGRAVVEHLKIVDGEIGHGVAMQIGCDHIQIFHVVRRPRLIGQRWRLEGEDCGQDQQPMRRSIHSGYVQ